MNVWFVMKTHIVLIIKIIVNVNIQCVKHVINK